MFMTTGTLHRRLFPSLTWKMESPHVFLTFDDGPHPRATPAVLEVLKSHDVPATFFFSGCNIAGNEAIVRETAERGHTLGIHAWSHTRMLVVSKRRTADEIRTTRGMIERAAGVTPVWFRPPFGMFSWNTVGAAREAGCSIAMWTVMPGDFKPWAQETIIERAMSAVSPGAIVVLHDNALTEARIVPLLDAMIRRMKDAGCSFDRMPQAAARR
jgi:peptidoglycan-N-acetylglucosamine deacetylase